MADLTTLITNLQADVDAADSDTSMRDILALLHRGSKITTFHKWYDSASVLPIDSAYGGYIAFTKSDNALRVFNDSDRRWAALDSALEAAAEPSVRQAENYGFYGGGLMPSIGAPWNYIQKFSLTSDANATDVGDLTDYKSQNVGTSSSTHGYSMGGFIGYGPNNPSTTNVIEKYSHTVDGNATDAGDLLAATRMGSSAFSPTDGFYMAGYTTPGANLNTIQSFPFASDGDTTDTSADLLIPTRIGASCMSSTHGYVMGGYPGSPNPTGDYVDQIQKFPFTSGSNATDVANLLAGIAYGDGKQSDTHGYHSGGLGAVPAPGNRNEIQKFTFASDADATDVGDLTGTRYPGTSLGVASTTHGYTGGGANPYVNTIDKFSLSSDGDATDVGDMLAGAVNYGTSQN